MTSNVLFRFVPTMFAVSALFYIFVIWVLWMIVKCLKGIDSSLKEISRASPDKI